MISCKFLVTFSGAITTLYTYSRSHLQLIDILNGLLEFLELGIKSQGRSGAQLPQEPNWYSCQSHTNVTDLPPTKYATFGEIVLPAPVKFLRYQHPTMRDSLAAQAWKSLFCIILLMRFISTVQAGTNLYLRRRRGVYGMRYSIPSDGTCYHEFALYWHPGLPCAPQTILLSEHQIT